MQQFCNSPFRTFRCAVVTPIIMLAAAAVPALAQNAVPPTARQAASSTAFASRLGQRATVKSAGKKRSVSPSCGVLPSPQDQIVYDNGPYNGTTDAWTINFGFSASDSFTCTGTGGGCTLKDFHMVNWNIPGFVTTGVEIQFGASSFGNNYADLVIAPSGSTDLGANQFGYELWQYDFTFANVNVPSGTSWVTLTNATDSGGNPVYWDENSGPSSAYENSVGSIASETFSITGSAGPPPPPPCFEPDGVIQILHDFDGAELGSGYVAGVTMNEAGQLYGTTVEGGGDYGAGMLYKLVPGGQAWSFIPLYSFTGGYNGSDPSSVIIGPDGALYGTARGGNKTCGSAGNSYCGLVFRLRPAPVACRTALCGWTEDVLYRFAGNNDAWSPTGSLTFDHAGNLYGTASGGDGTVFEVTPTGGAWMEKVIYTFTAWPSGTYPGSLLAGKDGNLYGIFYSGSGIVFQLVPSASGWTENTIYDFDHGADNNPTSLSQDSAGDLYGIATTGASDGCMYNTYDLVFRLAPVDGGWIFTEVFGGDRYWGYDAFIPNLAIDTTGDSYFTLSYYQVTWPHNDQYAWSTILGSGIPDRYTPNYFDPGGPLAIDAGHLYGTTSSCGSHGHGTLWSMPH